jgi:hypothetical protein
MLNRKDLSKEFELVVRQEIKNYNDTVLSTNISLNRCNQKLDDLAKEINTRFAVYESKLLEKDSKSNIQKESLDQTLSRLLMMIGNLESKLLSNLNDSISSSQKSNEVYSKKEDVYRVINHIGSDLTALNLKILSIKEDYAHQIKCISREFKEELERFKRELLDRPSEAIKVKQDLEKKIDSVSIDAEGVLKEIRVYKKESMIIEKKIENIYTLIERLNKRVS